MSTMDASLREKLDDKDESIRAFATEDAGFDDKVEDVEPLVERLRREPSRHVREAIVTALCKMTHDAVTDRALPLLESDDAFLRSAAVSVLQSRGESVVGRLAGAFPLADADVRKLLLDTASALHGEDAERVLLMGLDDRDVNVCIAAVEYLGERLRPGLKPRFEALVTSGREPMLVSTALAALEPIGDASSWTAIAPLYLDMDGVGFLVPQLLRVLASCAPESALGTFFEVGPRLGEARIGDWVDGLESFQSRFGFRRLSPEQFEVLRAILSSSPNPSSKLRILKWMGRLDAQPDVVATLRIHLESSDATVRRGAALGLGRLETAEARETLAARLPVEDDADVRAAIRGCLSSGEAVATP